MNKLFYPAIFHREDEGFWVSFPDFPECLTEGDDIPAASLPEELDIQDGIPVIVEFDMQEYLRKHHSRAVKKTLTIPEWLNEEAMARGINFSQVLQEALIGKLDINR